MSKPGHVPLQAEDLDELDRAILDFLQEGRDKDVPWGIATPSVVRAHLIEIGHFEPGEEPVRQTINKRMRDMALAGHLDNRYGKGEYVFVNDPRYD